jgi:DNA-binding winged helix-turn-helix (wHTH) protein/TolB-like protein
MEPSPVTKGLIEVRFPSIVLFGMGAVPRVSDIDLGAPVRLARTPVFRLGVLSIEPPQCLVRHDDGREEKLEPRVMEVLVALARAEGQPVSRTELVASCWEGRSVSADAVNRVIARLRALGQDIATEAFSIETLNKVGYRMLVAAPPAPASPPAPALVDTATRRGQHDRRSLLAAGGLVGLLAAGGLYLGVRPTGQHDADNSPVVLVMPFDAQGDRNDQLWLATSMAQSIRDTLGRVPGVIVIGAATSAAIARESLSAQQLSGRTGASLIIAGGISGAGDPVALSLTMTEANSGRQLWSTLVQGRSSHPRDMERDAAAAIVEQLAPACHLSPNSLPVPSAGAIPKRTGLPNRRSHCVTISGNCGWTGRSTSPSRGARKRMPWPGRRWRSTARIRARSSSSRLWSAMAGPARSPPSR